MAESIKRRASHSALFALGARVPGILGLAAGLLLVTFLLVHLVPGDPARNLVGITGTQEQVDAVRDQLGLNDSLPRQFGDYLGGLVTGDLGTSFTTGQPVSQMLGQRLPVTAELAGLGVLIVLLVGFPLGIAVAAAQNRRKSRWVGSSFTSGAGVIGALPEYVVGTVLILAFALTLHVLPAQGGTEPRAVLMPAITVALAPTAVFARLVRNEAMSVLEQDYIATARSKRLPSWRLYLTHLLPNVVTSALTFGGLILISLLGSTVITENVFNIPGLGTQVVQAILSSDYPVIRAVILVLGLLSILIMVIVDIILAALDPRTLTRMTV